MDLSIKLSLNALYGALRPLAESSFSHYWVYAAKRLGLSSIKLLMAGDAVHLHSASFVRRFIDEHRLVAMYPMSFLGIHCGYGFRALTTKEFTQAVFLPFVSYTCHSVIPRMRDGTLKWGVPFLFSESVMDAETLSRFYPISFAYLRSAMSVNLCRMVSCFTDKVIVVPDNDEAGQKASRVMTRSLSRFGIRVYFIKFPASYNDPGDLIKALMAGKSIQMETAYLKRQFASIGG